MKNINRVILMASLIATGAQAELNWGAYGVLSDSQKGTDDGGTLYADAGEVHMFLVYNGIGASAPPNISYNADNNSLVSWDGSNLNSVAPLNIVDHDVTNDDDFYWGDFGRTITNVYLNSWGETSPSWEAMNDRSFTIIAISDVDGDYSEGAWHGIYTGTPSGFSSAFGSVSIAFLDAYILDASGDGPLNIINTDEDDDGIQDAWEIEHFETIENCNPTNDPDGDLYFNIEEFQNNTDPNVFDPYLMQGLTTAVELQYKAALGKVYQVQMNTNITSGIWHDIGSPVEGDGQMHYMLEPTRGADIKSYRIIINDLPQ